MKYLVHIAFYGFLIVFNSLSLFGQEPPCGPSNAPGNDVCNATLICDFNGYCGSTPAKSVSAWADLKSAVASSCTAGIDNLTLDNDRYLKFVAGSSNISLDVYVSNCQKPVTTKAIQMAVFSAASCNSGPVDVKWCDLKMMQQAAPHPVNVGGLTPGQTYYILIDGYSGQNCNFKIAASSGISAGVTADIAQNSTLCAGQSVTVTAGGGSGTYTWSGDAGLGATSGTTVTITPPTTPGAYNYKISSSGSITGGGVSCPTSNEYNFTINVQATGGATPTFNQVGPTCAGASFTLPSTSTNGIVGTWSPAVDVNATKTYTFTPSGSGCGVSPAVQMTVTVNQKITPTFTNPGPICAGTTFTLPTTSNDNPSITGTWSPAANNTATTNYTFTPASTECANSTQMNVVVDNQITPSFNIPASICSGATVNLPTTSNNGVSGTWNPSTFDNQNSGQYVFTPSNASGSCQAVTATYNVTVNPTPDVIAQGDGICTGETTAIPLTSSVAGTTFSWTSTSTVNVSGASNGSGNSIDQTLTCSDNTGSVTYTITPTLGSCTGTPINITVNVQASLPITISPQNKVICQGDSVNLTIAGNANYTWSPSTGLNQTTGNSVIATPSSTTTYTVSGTSAAGCSGTATVTITVLPNPNASFSATPTNGGAPLAVSITNTSSNASSYSWDFGNGQSTQPTPPTVTYTNSGTFQIVLIASNGTCQDTASITITVVDLPEVVITPPNVFSPNGDGKNDEYFIYTENAKAVYVEIFNRWGNLLTKLETPTAKWDGQKATDGVYFYKYKITDLKDTVHEGHGFFHLVR